MAASTGQTISNVSSGAATGASVGGPWGALIGGAGGLVASAFGSDPEEERRKAQAAYEAQMRAAGKTYTDSQGQIIAGYQGLQDPNSVKQSLEGYTGALESANPEQYKINAGDYQSTYKDPLASWQSYLDPSIAYQQESARKNIEESAAGQGGLYGGAAAREIASDTAKIAEQGYQDAYDRARQAGMDVNDITGENFTRGINAGNYNVNLAQTDIDNMGTAYGVRRDIMDTVAGGQSDLNKTQFDLNTGIAQTNLTGDLGNSGGPSTWDSIIGGVGQANDAGLFNKSFWNFGGN